MFALPVGSERLLGAVFFVAIFGRAVENFLLYFMNFHMGFQVAVGCEASFTIFTDEIFQFGMGQLVSFEIGCLSECLSASFPFALVGPLSGVDRLVFGERGQLGEGLLAHGYLAYISFDTGMDEHVFLQALFGTVEVFALGALDLFAGLLFRLL